MQGLLGKKIGMTQVYDKKGRRVAVTVIELGPCLVVQRKTREKDGYEAAQLGFAEQKESRVIKPLLGRFKKIGKAPHRYLKEFRLDKEEDVNEGDVIGVDTFDGCTHVDISAKSKGRGFQGGVKRHNMRGGRMTHGGHAKRKIGSIGQCSYPARVAKGQRMPGHMGNKRITMECLSVVDLIGEDNLLLVCGAVPGANGGIVEVRKSLKKSGR